MTLALAKYRHLDLTFLIDGLQWRREDALGTSTLIELGFAAHPTDTHGGQLGSELERTIQRASISLSKISLKVKSLCAFS